MMEENFLKVQRNVIFIYIFMSLLTQEVLSQGWDVGHFCLKNSQCKSERCVYNNCLPSPGFNRGPPDLAHQSKDLSPIMYRSTSSFLPTAPTEVPRTVRVLPYSTTTRKTHYEQKSSTRKHRPQNSRRKGHRKAKQPTTTTTSTEPPISDEESESEENYIDYDDSFRGVPKDAKEDPKVEKSVKDYETRYFDEKIEPTERLRDESVEDGKTIIRKRKVRVEPSMKQFLGNPHPDQQNYIRDSYEEDMFDFYDDYSEDIFEKRARRKLLMNNLMNMNRDDSHGDKSAAEFAVNGSGGQLPDYIFAVNVNDPPVSTGVQLLSRFARFTPYARKKSRIQKKIKKAKKNLKKVNEAKYPVLASKVKKHKIRSVKVINPAVKTDIDVQTRRAIQKNKKTRLATTVPTPITTTAGKQESKRKMPRNKKEKGKLPSEKPKNVAPPKSFYAAPQPKPVPRVVEKRNKFISFLNKDGKSQKSRHTHHSEQFLRTE